jgi:hypothetical protein
MKNPDAFEKGRCFLSLSLLMAVFAAGGCASDVRTERQAAWRAPAEHPSQVETPAKTYTGSPTDFTPQAPMPRYTSELNGDNEVSFLNPNGYPVLVAIRSGNGGKDVKVPAQASRSVSLPKGSYRVYMVPAIDPSVCYRGDYFDLPQGNPIQVTIPSFKPIE